MGASGVHGENDVRSLFRGTCLFPVVLIAAVTSCVDASKPPARGRAVVKDSAGIVVVELQGDLARFAIPENDLVRTYRIGNRRSGLDLFKVSGARFLPDGSLVVANAGVLEIVTVDPEGRVTHRFGGEGEGPGHFLTLTSIHVSRTGTILAYDDRQGRLTEFDAVGTLLGTRRMAEPSQFADLVPLVASMAGPSLAVNGDNRSFGGGSTIRRDTTPLFRYAATSMRPDTLSMWPSKVWSFGSVSMGMMRAQVVFSPNLLATGQGNRVALADSHEPHVSVLDSSGELIMLVRWAGMPRTVTETDLKLWRETRTAELPPDLPDAIRRGFLEVPHHEVHPLLSSIVLERDGGLWIAPTELKSGTEQTWLLLDSSGLPRGGVSLPASSRILDVAGSNVVMISQNDLDVELITVFAIRSLRDGAPGS